MTGAGFGLAYAGFTALCLAMERHQRDALGRRLRPRAAGGLRWLGWAALAASALPLAAGEGSVGVVRWLGVLTASAGLLVLLLALAPRVVVAAGWLLPALALLGPLLALLA